MKFDVVVTNPPFQDRENRGRTPHKLWIEFTEYVFEHLLVDDGILCQVSPSSFQSPSNRILELMKKYDTERIDLDTGVHFPGVGSTFSDYTIRRRVGGDGYTLITRDEQEFRVRLDASVMYLPNDMCEESLSIHRKVIFTPEEKLAVEKDYVTCHNIILRKGDSLSKEETATHIYPVLHTNRQTWWSSIRQDWANSPKVMWSRSGYTLPFFDDGELGGTDMVYFVRVKGKKVGEALAHNLNLKLMKYIYATAKWSGFGNERVFAALPQLPTDRKLTDQAAYDLFSLDPKEVDYVERYVG